MTAFGAGQAGAGTRFLRVLALTGVLGLAGCADVDNMLFGNSTDNAGFPAPADNGAGNAQAPSQPGTLPPSPEAGESDQSMAGTLPAYQGAGGATVSGTLSPTITAIPIDPGSDTGTAVSKTIAGLRAQITTLQNNLMTNAQRYADLRNSGAGSSSVYQEAKAHIITRLQLGTTRGNPELVNEWNNAQGSLDNLSGNINSMNSLGTLISGDSSSAHFTLDQISATFNVSGAVDEDHRQLSVLEDETNQIIVLMDRLLKDLAGDIQRQTAFIANERVNLTTLANAIKNGELYDANFGSSPLAMGGAVGSLAAAGAPLVVIKFDKPNVDYQQILYSALTQTLQSRPGAGFSVIAVSPTRGSAAAVELAQTAARRHAQDVLRTITEMGVPAGRLTIASATDPSAQASEVRVFIR